MESSSQVVKASVLYTEDREFNPHLLYDWSVTQLAEWETVNFQVVGSSPTRPALEILHSGSA